MSIEKVFKRNKNSLTKYSKWNKMYSKETESEVITRHIILANKKEMGYCKSNSPVIELRSAIKQKKVCIRKLLLTVL